MPLLNLLVRGLAFMGRHGAMGFAVSIFLGLALPQLAAAFRPILPVTIFLFVMLSFARADFSGIRRELRTPFRLFTAFVWMMLAMPFMIVPAVLALGRDALEPGLLLGMALVAAGPPLMGFPAYASLLGLDNSLGLTLLVFTMALTPIVAPPVASYIAGTVVPLDPVVLGVRLLLLMGGSALTALAVRRLFGVARIAARKHELDGFNVILYFVFAIAAMDGVIETTWRDPSKVALYMAVGTGLAVLGFTVSNLVLRRIFGKSEAFVLGLGTGMRNTGTLVAVMGSACPPDTYLFFSLLQFPIYLAPVLAAPLARLIIGEHANRE
jgi:BASS family bile acid:Na+ symporter